MSNTYTHAQLHTQSSWALWMSHHVPVKQASQILPRIHEQACIRSQAQVHVCAVLLQTLVHTGIKDVPQQHGANEHQCHRDGSKGQHTKKRVQKAVTHPHAHVFSHSPPFPLWHAWKAKTDAASSGLGCPAARALRFASALI